MTANRPTDSNRPTADPGLLPAGKPAPDFSLASGPDAQLRLSELRGRPVILVFYPAD